MYYGDYITMATFIEVETSLASILIVPRDIQ